MILLCYVSIQLCMCYNVIISLFVFFSDDEEIHHIEIQRSGGGFGFSIRGGAEYNSQLCVLRIADGGAAERDARLRVREGGREREREIYTIH